MVEPTEPGDPGTPAQGADASPEVIDKSVFPPATTPPPRPALPRLWPTFVTILAVFPTAIMVTLFTMLPALMLIHGPGVISDAANLEQRLVELTSTPLGLLIAFIPGQLVFLGAALIPARLSPVPTWRRLALVKPRLPGWAYPLLLLATPAVSLINLVVMPLFADEPSEQIKSLYYMIHDADGGVFLSILVLLTVVPGLVEETFFRGYVQSRLLKRWTPLSAILVSSIVFSVAHLDPQHALSVFPVGLWCGIVAWRTGSVWPAALCHMFNNLLGVVSTRMTPEAAFLQMESSWTPASVVIVAICVAALAASVWVLATRVAPAASSPGLHDESIVPRA